MTKREIEGEGKREERRGIEGIVRERERRKKRERGRANERERARETKREG